MKMMEAWRWKRNGFAAGLGFAARRKHQRKKDCRNERSDFQIISVQPGEKSRSSNSMRPNLPQAARGIGGGRNLWCRRGGSRVCGDFVGRGLRQANAGIYFEMFLGAARAKRLARVFIAQAG
jgi:hypothetical protein